jgi:hypothetical protein
VGRRQPQSHRRGRDTGVGYWRSWSASSNPG